MIKISILTPIIKDYIKTEKSLPNRKLAENIQKEYGVKISHVTVGKYKKSLLETPKLTKITRPLTRNLVPRIPKKGFDLSINELKILLDQNLDHTFHDTLEHQFIGKTLVKNGKQTKVGGKLRANLMQLISFLKDVKN